MNSKIKIIIIAIVVVLAIVITVNINKKNNAIPQNDTYNITYEKDENTSEYIIRDPNTGEEITRVNDKAAVEVYKDNPNYDPKMTSGDSDFIDPNANIGEIDTTDYGK